VSVYFYIIVIFIFVDALKVYLEIWNRPVRRDFSTDLSQVTALIPTYNGQTVIRETVDDLIRAGFARDRILVVDDGSTDDTPGILGGLRVRSYRIPNMGKVPAINFGIHRVQTPLVLLLDDDTRIGDARIPTSLLEHYDAAAFNVVPDRRSRYGPKGAGLISCLQRYEYCKSMEIGRRFQDGTASISCVSGAIGLFKKERLQAFHHKHTGVFQGRDAIELPTLVLAAHCSNSPAVATTIKIFGPFDPSPGTVRARQKLLLQPDSLLLIATIGFFLLTPQAIWPLDSPGSMLFAICTSSGNRMICSASRRS